MSGREIPPAEWPAFLERFTCEHRAWLATVDRVRPDASARVEAVERPLDSVRPEVNARRVVGIAIQFQEGSDAGRSIRVDVPTRLRVDETEEGAVRGIEIDNGYGECTRLRFRAAVLPEQLDGIVPGEL